MAAAAKRKDPTLSMEKGAIFEVRRNGNVLSQTEYPSCYPSRERRDQLRKAGYKLYLGGKVFREEKVR